MAHCGFEVYEDDTEGYRWRFRSGNEVVTESGERYSSEREANEAADLLREEAPDARLSGDERPCFELYRDQDDEWRWRMIASNGQTITDSGERYASKHGAKTIIQTLKTSAGRAEGAAH